MLDGAAALQRQVLGQLSKLARSNGLKGLITASELSSAAALYQETWNLVWKIPQIIKSCENQSLCVSISNASAISDYRARALSLNALVRGAADRILRRSSALPRSAKRRVQTLRRAAISAQSAAQKVADQVPTTSSTCLGDS